MRDEYVDAVCRELEHRKEYLHEEVSTVYFGGGTPSQLSPDQVNRIIETIHNIYNVRARAELTIEANPDDLSASYLKSLLDMGVNRLSMGVQTFDDARLRFLHRRHSSHQAKEAVGMAREVGFDNISIDLMFGFPGQSLEEWRSDVEHAVELGVQHLSAYSLMYEEGTQLTRMLDRGEVSEVSEETSLKMYELLMDAMQDAGYEHYEISNFCKPGFLSRHNSSYWHGIPYLGVGAGAHSYDGRARHFNPDSLRSYMDGHPLEEETLSSSQRYDEFVFTGLRTSDGVCLAEIRKKFGDKYYCYCLENSQKHVSSGKMKLSGGILSLTRDGLFVSNDIMSDLMFV